MIACRYMDFKYGIKSVFEGRFKVTKPLDFNDPNEMRGSCTGDLRPEVYEQSLKTLLAMKANMPKKLPDGREMGSDEIIAKRLLSDFKRNFNQLLMEAGEFDKRNRILCFSDKDAGICENLMWAHYADKGSGVRIHVDLDKLDRTKCVIRQIQYCVERPMVDLAEFNEWMDPKVMEEYFERVIFTKGIEWAYEKEIRLLTNPKHTLRNLWDGVEFSPIPQASVVRIDFGPMVEIDKTDECVKALRDNASTSHIECYRTVFNTQAYQYIYQKIS